MYHLSHAIWFEHEYVKSHGAAAAAGAPSCRTTNNTGAMRAEDQITHPISEHSSNLFTVFLARDVLTLFGDVI